MDLYDWYYKQVVSPGELSAAFEAADTALKSMVTTLGIQGLAVGGDVVPTTPTAGLSAVVKGPVLAYDDDGNRIYLADANLAVNLAQDENGASTQIFTPGQERYLAIFVKFTRYLTDPRTDGDGNAVMFARLEGAEVVVAAGAPAPAGAASRAALRDGHVLLADVRITTGQTQVLAPHILTDRTQYLFRASSGSLDLWGRTFPEIVQKIVDRFAQFMADANQQFLLFGQQSSETYNNFVTTITTEVNRLAGLIKDRASQILFTPSSGITAQNVQAAIEEVKNTMPGTQTAAGTPFNPSVLTGIGDDVQEALEGMPAYLHRTEGTFTAKQRFGRVELSEGYVNNNWGVNGEVLYVDANGAPQLQYAMKQVPISWAYTPAPSSPQEGWLPSGQFGWTHYTSLMIPHQIHFPIPLDAGEQLSFVAVRGVLTLVNAETYVELGLTRRRVNWNILTSDYSASDTLVPQNAPGSELHRVANFDQYGLVYWTTLFATPVTAEQRDTFWIDIATKGPAVISGVHYWSGKPGPR